MALKDPRAKDYGKITHPAGQRTKKFADEFISLTGIVTSLRKKSDACIDNESPVVSFDIHGGHNYGNILLFSTYRDGTCLVQYNRVIANTNKELENKSALLNALKKLCTGDNGIEIKIFELENDPTKMFVVNRTVSLTNYSDYARFIGNLDKIISSYN